VKDVAAVGGTPIKLEDVTGRLRLAQCASSSLSPGRPQDRKTLGEDGVRGIVLEPWDTREERKEGK